MFNIGLGVFLSGLAIFFKAGKSISTKIGVTNAGEFVTSWSFRFVSFILFSIAVFVLGEFTIPSSSVFWMALVFNSCALSASSLLISKAFKVSDISVIAPLMALIPVVVSIPAWIVLGEDPSLLAGIGLICVTGGSYMLELRSDGFLAPLKRIKDDRGAQYIGLMLLIVSVTPTLDKIGLSNSSPLVWVFYLHFVISIILGLFVYVFEDDWESGMRNNWKVFVLIGLFNALVWAAQIFAYEVMYVAYVQGIKRASILISIIAGYFLFGEENIRNRLVGGVFIFVGVLLIVVGSGG
jgi:uncharacterized membrane protein